MKKLISALSLPGLVLMALFFASCSKEEHVPPPRESHFLVLNGDPVTSGTEPMGGLSSYTSPSGSKRSGVLENGQATFPYDQQFSDAVIKDGFAYLSTRLAGDLLKVSLVDFRVVASSQMYHDGYIKSHEKMELNHNQLILGYTRHVYPTLGEEIFDVAYLKIFDAGTLAQTDSIALMQNYEILDMETIGNMLYISLFQYEFTRNKLLKFNLQTKKIETQVSLPYAPAHLAASSKGALFALANGHFWKLDPQTLDVLQHESIYAEVNFPSNASAFALDEALNTIYYFKAVAQPSPIPYLLASFNLDTKEEKHLYSGSNPGIGAPIISFDKRRGEIVLTSWDKLLFLDKQGKLLMTAELDYEVNKLLQY